MAKNKKRAIIIDPNGDFEKARHRWPFFKEKLFSALGEFPVHFISQQHPITKICQQIAKQGVEEVLFLGEDATVHNGLNALIQFSKKLPTIGILCVSANSQAIFNSLYPNSRFMGDNERLNYCVKLIVQGKTRKIPLGKVTFINELEKEQESFFMNSASFGLSSKVRQRLPESAFTMHSGLAFIASSIRESFKFRAPSVTLLADSATPLLRKNIFNIFINRGSFSTSGILINENADLENEELSVLVIPDAPLKELAMELPKLWLKNQSPKNAKLFEGKKFRLEPGRVTAIDSGHRLELDNVVKGKLPAQFSVSSKYVNVFRL